MSTTATSTNGGPAAEAGPGPAGLGPATGSRLPEASLPESLGVLLTGVVPALVRGLFSPRRGAMKVLTRLNTDGRAVAVLSRLRRRHPGEGIRLLGGKIVVVWGEPAIRDVLEHSAELYAGDAGAKARGMAHFQPDALTLSRGEKWRNRRAFTESVLATGDWVHPLASRFIDVVADEVARLRDRTQLDWDEWERMFDHITLRVIFGDGAREDQELTARLEKLMGEANRLVGLSRSADYYELYARLERYLRDPEPGSLLARFADAPHDDDTRMIQQIPHWMFAMRDTLGANAYRALAVIAAHPAAMLRVREELDGQDLTDAGVIDRLRYLEGCLQEAMRLWPTTPLLVRETTAETRLSGQPLGEGTQVMLLNVFNHRDSEQVSDAAHLAPERWQDRPRDYRFNHLSNGTQDCPGGPLVLLLGKAVLAAVIDRFELLLTRPALDPRAPLTEMLDFFEIRFDLKGRTR